MGTQPASDWHLNLPPPPIPKLQAFHSFFKGCTSRYSTMHFSAQCPLKSMRIVEYVYTWGRWTEHPDRCVLHTICSTWLGKHLMAYYGVMWLATSQRLWAVESVIQNLQKCTRNSLILLHIYLYFHILFTYLSVIVCNRRRGKMEKRIKEGHGEGMSLSSSFFVTNVITRSCLNLSNIHSPIKQATTKSS